MFLQQASYTPSFGGLGLMGSASVQALRRENVDLKQLVAELSLEGYRLKQTAIPMPHDATGTNG